MNKIKERFIMPLLNKKTGNVGVELEFPMLNLAKEPVDKNIASALLQYFLENGFRVDDTTTNGEPAFIVNNSGDVISFDNSYNNIEFSMNYGSNLNDIALRFYEYFSSAQEYLKQFNYLITGLGINPYKKYINQSHVEYPVYNMVDKFLHEFQSEKTHNYPDFPAYLSSVQTHLDINAEDMPRTLTLMARLDFVRAMLFSNSLAFDDTDTICFRDYLWEKSAFGLLNKNTGKVDEAFATLDDIENSYLDRSMFNSLNDGEYQIFPPVLVKDYEGDLKTFLSFRNLEITARGTLEVRGDCAQPLTHAFAPPAFSLGIAHNVQKAECILNEFFEKTGINEKNSVLRDKVIYKNPIGANDAIISKLLTDLVSVAEEGLKLRNKGEGKMLQPLFERAKTLKCPALLTSARLENGEPIENIIFDYSRI